MAVAALFTIAAAQTFATGLPAFDPRQHKTEIAGPPSEVLVLGTMHLSALPASFDPKTLEPLLDRLARFQPQIITIEALSGEECDTLARFKAEHGADTWKDYCWPTDEVEKATGLTVPAATAEVDRALATRPTAPTPAQRRHLAMMFLAANDRASSMVQWLRLSVEERHAGDGLTRSMIDAIERKGKPFNENYAIAAVLAARLGLERVYPADDHVADTAMDENSPEGRAYADAIQHAWRDRPPPPVRVEEERLEKSLDSPARVLTLYRLLNSPAYQRAAIAADMGRNAKFTSPKLYGRQYLAWWETRNLRMVANIRAAMSGRPGSRVLAIVGSAHKGYFDAYLNMMQDVRILDTSQLLR